MVLITPLTKKRSGLRPGALLLLGIICFFFFAVGDATAQDASAHVTISGKVLDTAGRPIEGVFITTNFPPFGGTTSDEAGVFHITIVPPGAPLQLEIVKEGYFPRYEILAPSQLKAPQEFTLKSLTPAPGAAVAAGAGVGQDMVHIEADTLSYEQEADVYHARGHVVVTYADGVLSAAMVDFYHKTIEAVAEGQVVLQSRDGDVLEGEKVRLDVTKKTGVADDGQVFVSSTHFYVRGDRIEKRGDATYFVVNAEATSCDGANPDWRLAGRELDVTVDGYGSVTQGRFYAGRVPLFYSPYLFFPVKTTRQTGFLLPERLAYSQNKLGWDVSIPFFWAISDNTDATFYQRYMSERGFQEGVEFRYSLSKDSLGTVYGDFLNDSKKITETVGNVSRDWQTEQKRWAFYLNHETRFDPTLYLRADIARVSDNFYFKDFSSYNYFLSNYAAMKPQPFKKMSFLADESLSFLDSTVRMTKNWQNYSLNGLLKSTQDLTLPSNDGTLQRYPEIALSGIKQKLLGTRAAYELSGIYDYFYRGQGQKGHLLDIYPTLSLPLGLGDYFQVTPFAGIRSLVWSRDDNTAGDAGKQGNREVYTAGAMASSEVSRVYNIGGKSLDKVRHAVVPEVTYFYSPHARQEGIPDFITTATQSNAATMALSKTLNQTGAALAGDQNSVTYALTNTLTARFNEPGGKRRYVEFLRFKLAQTYDIKEAAKDGVPIDGNRKLFSDVNMELDLKPFSYMTLMARNIYNVYTTNWVQANYDLILNDRRGDTASVTYRYTQNSIEETNLALTAVVTNSLRLLLRLSRDHLNARDVEKTVGFDYRRQCWAIGLDYGERNNDRTYAFRFAIYGL